MSAFGEFQTEVVKRKEIEVNRGRELNLADKTHVKEDFNQSLMVHDVEDFDIDCTFGGDDGEAKVEGDGFDTVFLDDSFEISGGGT
jgi:hypothetical protein